MSNASVSNGAGPKKIGHRFEKGHPHYPPKHPFQKINRSNHARLKKRIIRDLIIEFGPDLSVKQMQHIHSIGDLSARLQLLSEAADPIAAATLANTIHRHLEALNE
jgi:hypothetical protein